jgi:hypothetical protein
MLELLIVTGRALELALHSHRELVLENLARRQQMKALTAHNVKEKSLETIRMARALAERKAGNKSDHAFEFEMASYLTLGAAYDTRRGLSGGAYMSVLRHIDDFLDEAMPKALRERERRGAKVLKLDDAVAAVVAALKERGMTSPYLKAFVVARVNPIRFSKSTEFDFDCMRSRHSRRIVPIRRSTNGCESGAYGTVLFSSTSRIRNVACHRWNWYSRSWSELRYVGEVWPRVARLNMRHSPMPSTAPRCTPKPTTRRVNWSITTSTQ